MNSCDGATERSPTALIDSQCQSFVVISHQVGTQYRPHADFGTGSDELDCPIYAVSVGAGQRTESPLGGGLGQRLGTGDPNPEGEVRVNVEVGEHLFSTA
jgi:hypothetical protein